MADYPTGARAGSDDAVDKDARRDHPFRVYTARLDDLVNLGYGDAGGGNDGGVPSALGPRVDQVAYAVGAGCPDQREIPAEGRLIHAFDPVYYARFPSPRRSGCRYPPGGKHATDAGAGRAHAFRQRSPRNHFDGQVAGAPKILDNVVLARAEWRGVKLSWIRSRQPPGGEKPRPRSRLSRRRR